MNMSGRWHTWHERCTMGSTSRVNVGCSGTVPPSFAAAAAGLTATQAKSTMARTQAFDNDMRTLFLEKTAGKASSAPDAGNEACRPLQRFPPRLIPPRLTHSPRT